MVDEEGLLCVEMESFALFHNAEVLGRNAACLLTISDSLVTGEELDADARATAFAELVELALEAAIAVKTGCLHQGLGADPESGCSAE